MIALLLAATLTFTAPTHEASRLAPCATSADTLLDMAGCEIEQAWTPAPTWTALLSVWAWDCHTAADSASAWRDYWPLVRAEADWHPWRVVAPSVGQRVTLTNVPRGCRYRARCFDLSGNHACWSQARLVP